MIVGLILAVLLSAGLTFLVVYFAHKELLKSNYTFTDEGVLLKRETKAFHRAKVPAMAGPLDEMDSSVSQEERDAELRLLDASWRASRDN